MVELTGISEFTIRGWENRYSAFEPNRGKTGRRQYSKADVERALLLRELLKRGHKIGNVAPLSSLKLKNLFESAANRITVPDAPSKSQSELANRALELVALQKWTEPDSYIKNIPHKNATKLIHEFFLPALKLLSEKIEAGHVSIAQEHIFSSLIKEKIHSALSALELRKKGKTKESHIRFVLAAPEGDYHETGLLLAHLLIRSLGYTSLYLGPHTPAQDLSETALRFDCSHLLIVATVCKKGGARQEPLSYISEVQKKVGLQTQIVLAGHQAPIAFEAKYSLTILKDFSSFEEFLERLQARK